MRIASYRASMILSEEPTTLFPLTKPSSAFVRSGVAGGYNSEQHTSLMNAPLPWRQLLRRARESGPQFILCYLSMLR